mmetsp:Transcript_17162/g.48737  ORF Transcript_17162/g.48737 Transcript_17162/m.48737 type:complete len:105 (-) Transcript_17162:129-443(-)
MIHTRTYDTHRQKAEQWTSVAGCIAPHTDADMGRWPFVKQTSITSLPTRHRPRQHPSTRSPGHRSKKKHRPTTIDVTFRDIHDTSMKKGRAPQSRQDKAADRKA